VKWTGEARGYGAFAGEHIPAGTFIGCYEGELLDLESYYTRYPEGMSDYCIAIDSEYVLDGAARALDRENFSSCHINHSATRNNVSRRTLPRQQSVQIFANQDIRYELTTETIMAA
jgi:SET domain-containing protein